jgi:hypothetical protein
MLVVEAQVEVLMQAHRAQVWQVLQDKVITVVKEQVMAALQVAAAVQVVPVIQAEH